ncbi:MAG: RNA polymerase factor sigma-54, partial [Tepidisphaeraceae bacterium]
MSLSQSFSMRMDQRQVLTPRMIQSMEILQLPLGALEERIDQEMQVNPVLEMRVRDREAGEAPTEAGPTLNRADDERSLAITDDGAADFRRLDRLSDYLENEEFSTNSTFRPSHWAGQDRDAKMDAMANTASRGSNLTEH